MSAKIASTLLLPKPSPQKLYLPLFGGKVSAGFPLPADDYIQKTLDLNELLIQKPVATFFARSQEISMVNAGIHPNDILYRRPFDRSRVREYRHLRVEWRTDCETSGTKKVDNGN